ncbi:MAG: undecaprenyl-diphosphate phosphatase [Desulfobacterales bacterium]|nr:undecaprenyl-diphosphate phosphatase [Desulfobacterales bacterium]
MEIIDSIFLGIIQGLTEFLPVSSSGHLVFFQDLLGFKEPELLLDCSLHLGTLLAVCFYFRIDLKKMALDIWQSAALFLKSRVVRGSSHTNLAFWILVASVPTGLIGLTFRKTLEGFFESVSIVGVMLIISGVIIASTKLIPKDHGTRTELGLPAALAVGLVQGLAIIPGISRSGITITCGMLMGLDRELAGRFSFLLSIPAIIGALILQLNFEDLERVGLIPLVFGVLTSALLGFLALKVLMGIVNKGRLHYFAPYCWTLGCLIIILR